MALTSGLTLEEAALVQPSYGFVPRTPAIPDDAIDAIASNWSGIVDDVPPFEFSIDSKFGFPDDRCEHSRQSQCQLFVVLRGSLPAANSAAANSAAASAYRLIQIEFGHANQRSTRSHETSASSNGYPNPSDDSARILIEFDVETTSPTMLLATRPYAASLQTYFGEEATYGRNEVGLFLSDDASDLLFDHRTSEFYYSNIGPHMRCTMRFHLLRQGR